MVQLDARLFWPLSRCTRSLCFWLGCILVFSSTNAFAAAFTNKVSQYIAYDWQTKDGLPHDSINAIVQTREGYLWLATKEGLVRFDGVRFVSMDSCFQGIKNHSFTGLCESREGTLWVTSEDGKLRGLKNGRGFELQLPGTITNGFLTRTFESRDGSLWIGTETNGLVRFKDGTFTRITQRDGLAHNSIRSICEDDDGNIWIATAAGVNCWKDGKFRTLDVKDGLLHNSTRVVYFDRQENLWVASHFGLTLMKNGVARHYRKKEGLSDNLINCLLEDRQGVLWVGTFNGLNRIVGGELYHEMRADGSSYDRVNSIVEDNEGNIWIGSRSGLTRLKPRVVTTYAQQQGLTYNNATSVLEDNAGDLWVGFWGGGVNHIHEGKVKGYTRRERLSSDLVMTMHQSRNGNLWIGMDYEGGLNLFGTEKITHYKELEGFKDDAVKVIQDDSQGNLWVGTRTALLRFKDNQFHRFTMKAGLPSDTVEAICEDRIGRLWFGTPNGLAMLQNEKFVSFTTRDGLSDNFVTSIYEDVQGTLWLGTHGGLNRLRDGKFTSYTTKNGLFRDEILSVIEDDAERLWMGSRKGIFCVDKDELNDLDQGKIRTVSCVSFGKVDGMASEECKGSGRAAAMKSRSGLLWFPTSKGIVSIDPKGVKVNSDRPQVVLEELMAGGKSIDLSANLKLVADNQEFVFRFTAFNFSTPEKIRFKYKLEGHDEDWIDSGSLREAHYQHLSPGNYRFHVTAANGSGIWNEEGYSLGFTLMPPFWRTWWFSCLSSLAIFGMVAGGYRYISVQKLKRQLAALEQQHAIEKERARIAKDMHDDLGANLTRISILSELAKREANEPGRVVVHADAISDTAREVVQSMDEIVWAANPKNDSVRKLSAYIFQYAELFLAPTQIRGRFDHPTSLPEHGLSAEVRHNLFLVVKEALNNVVKHSMANEVWLRFAFNRPFIEIKIEDNGKGFVPDMNRPSGNGFTNMKKRIEDIGGRFELRSAPGTGTKIEVVVEIKSEL